MFTIYITTANTQTAYKLIEMLTFPSFLRESLKSYEICYFTKFSEIKI